MKMRICYLAWPLGWGDAEEIVILSVQCVGFSPVLAMLSVPCSVLISVIEECVDLSASPCILSYPSLCKCILTSDYFVSFYRR